MKILVVISIILLWSANICFAQPVQIKIENKKETEKATETQQWQPQKNTRSYFDFLPLPSEQWFRRNNTDKNVLEQNLFDFYDGNFELLGRLKRAFMANELYEVPPRPLTLDDWRKLVVSAHVLMYPWRTAEKVTLVQVGNNTLVQLSPGQSSDAFIGQEIIFTNRQASIEFDAYVIDAGPNDSLEVLVTEPLIVTTPIGEEEDFSLEKKVFLTSYRLSKFSSSEHVVVDLSKNQSFSDFFDKNGKRRLGVIIRLLGDKKKPTVINLDNLKINYSR